MDVGRVALHLPYRASSLLIVPFPRVRRVGPLLFLSDEAVGGEHAGELFLVLPEVPEQVAPVAAILAARLPADRT